MLVLISQRFQRFCRRKSYICLGNLGKDFVHRTAGNSEVYQTSIGVYDGKDKTQWFNVDFWGKQGEVVSGLVGKGDKLCVSGELKTHEYEGKTYLTVNGQSFSLVGKSDKQDSPQPTEETPF